VTGKSQTSMVLEGLLFEAPSQAWEIRTKTAILVISLDTSTQRRAEFSKSAAGVDLDWSFFSAHKGVISPLAYNDRDAIRHCGRALFPAEIGCYVSHFKCWEWLANSKLDQAIILEDDVMVDWSAITKLVQFNLSAHLIELLRLFATHPITCKIVMYQFLSSHCHLVRTEGWHLGAQGYILTNTGACRLTEKYANITIPLDWVLMRYWEHGLGSYSLFPFPIIERRVPSTIGPRASVTKAPLVDRAMRFCWRMRDRVEREWFDHLTAERWPLGPSVDVGPVFVDQATGQVAL
jgi:glycosyl transferase, family 25